MPFGLTNVFAAFMDLMNRFFRYALDQYIIVFIDDILVYSKSLEKHAIHLSEVLGTLRWNQLFTKLSKCSFWLDWVSFFRHVILSEGVSVDPAKVEKVIN